MARNNKKTLKYRNVIEQARREGERIEASNEYFENKKDMTKESIKKVMELLHRPDEVIVGTNVMTVPGDTKFKKNEVTKSYDFKKRITPIIQGLYDTDFFSVVSGKKVTAEERMLKTIDYNLKNNPIRLNQRGSANENLVDVVEKLSRIQELRTKGKESSFFVYDTETIGGRDTEGIWRPMAITEFSMHEIDGAGDVKGLGRMDVVMGLREYNSKGEMITDAKELPIIKDIKEAIESGNIAGNEELRVTASRFSLYGDKRTKIVQNADGSFRVGSFISSEEGDMTDINRIIEGAQRLIDVAKKSNQSHVNGVPIDVYKFMNSMASSMSTVEKGLGMYIDQNGSMFDMPVINSSANKYLAMYPQLRNMFDGRFKNGFGFSPSVKNHFDFLGALQQFQDIFGAEELYGQYVSMIEGGGFNKQENILKVFFDSLELPPHVASSDVQALGSFVVDSSDVLKEVTGTDNLIDFLHHKLSTRRVNTTDGIELIPGKHLLRAKNVNTGKHQGKGLLNFSINDKGEVFTYNDFMVRGGVAEHKNFNVGAGFNEGSYYTIKSIKQVDVGSDYIDMINEAYPQHATNKMFAVTLDRAVTSRDAKSRQGMESQVLLFNSETEMHAGLANYFNISAKINDDGTYDILKMDDFDIREFDVIKGRVVTKDTQANYAKTPTQMVEDAIDFQNQKVRTSKSDYTFNRGNAYNKFKQGLEIQDLSRKVLGRTLVDRELENIMAMSENVSKGNMAITLEQAQAMQAGVIDIFTYKGKYEYYQSSIDNFSAYMDVINMNENYYRELYQLVENSSAFKAAGDNDELKKVIFDNADKYAREYLANNLYDHKGRIKKSILGNEALQADLSYFKGLYEIDLSGMSGAIEEAYVDITQSKPEGLVRLNLNKTKSLHFTLLDNIRTVLHGDRDIREKDSYGLHKADFKKFASHILNDDELTESLSEKLVNQLINISQGEDKDYNPYEVSEKFIRELRRIKETKPLAGIISNDLQMRTLTSNSGFNRALNGEEFINNLREIMPDYLDSLKVSQLDGSREKAELFVKDNILKYYVPNAKDPKLMVHRNVVTEMQEYLTDIVHAIDSSGSQIYVDNKGKITVKKSNGKFESLHLPKIKQFDNTDSWYINLGNKNVKLENAVIFGLSKSSDNVTMTAGTTFGQVVGAKSVTGRAKKMYENSLAGKAENEGIQGVLSLIRSNNKQIGKLSSINSFNANDMVANNNIDFYSIKNILPELFGKGGRLRYLVEGKDFLDSKLVELMEKDMDTYIRRGTVPEELGAHTIKDLTKNMYELLKILAENAGVEDNEDIQEIINNVSFTANEKLTSDLKGVLGRMNVYSPQSPINNTQRPTILASGNAIPMRMKNVEKVQAQSNGVLTGNMISTALTDKHTLANINGIGEVTTDITMNVAYVDTNGLEILRKNNFNKVMRENSVDYATLERMTRINTFEQERHMDSRVFEGIYGGMIPAQIENVSASKDIINLNDSEIIKEQLDKLMYVRGDFSFGEDGTIKYNSAIGKRVTRGETVLYVKGYNENKLDTFSPKMEEGIFIHRYVKSNNMALTDEEISTIINRHASEFKSSNNKIINASILERILEEEYDIRSVYRVESTKAMGLIKPMTSSAEKGMTNLNYTNIGTVNDNIRAFIEELGVSSNVRGSTVTEHAIRLYAHEAGAKKLNMALKAGGFNDLDHMLKVYSKERHSFNATMFDNVFEGKANLVVNDGVIGHGNSGQIQFGVLQKAIDNIVQKYGGDTEKAYKEVVDVINTNEKYQFLRRIDTRTTKDSTADLFEVSNGRIYIKDMGTELDDLSITQIDKLKDLIIKLDDMRGEAGESVVHRSGYIRQKGKSGDIELVPISEDSPVLGAWTKTMIGDKEVLLAPITKESVKILPDVETQSGSDYKFFELKRESMRLKDSIDKSGDADEKAKLTMRLNSIDEELRNYENVSKRMKITNLEYKILDRMSIQEDYLNALERNLRDGSVNESFLANSAIKNIVQRVDGKLQIVSDNEDTLRKPLLNHWLQRYKGQLTYNPLEELQLTDKDILTDKYKHLAEVYERAKMHDIKVGRDSAEKIYKSEMAELAVEFNKTNKYSLDYMKKKGFEVKNLDDINFEIDEVATKNLIVDLGDDFDGKYRYIASPGLGYRLGDTAADEILTNGQKELRSLARMGDDWRRVRNVGGKREEQLLRMQEKVTEARGAIRKSVFGKNAFMDTINTAYVDDVNYRLKASGAVTSNFTKGLENLGDLTLDDDLLSGSFIGDKSLAELHKDGAHYDYKFVSLETMRNKGMFNIETMRNYGIDVDNLTVDEAEKEMRAILKRTGTMDITGRYPNNMIDSLTVTHMFLDETLEGNQTKVSGVSGLKMLLDFDGDSVSSFSLNYITDSGAKIDYGMYVTNPNKVKEISQEAFNTFQGLEGLTSYRAITENHVWLKDVNDTIVKDVLRNADMSDLANTALVPGGNSVLGEITPAAISRIDLMADYQANENFIKEVIDKSDEFLLDKSFASKVSLIKNPENNAQILDNALSVMKIAEQEKLINKDYLARAENAAITKLATEKAATATLAKTGLATTGAVNAATNAIKKAAYEVIDTSRSTFNTDLLDTILYLPEQEAISYKKVTSVYNDTKGRDIADILSVMFPHNEAKKYLSEEDMHAFKTWYREHAFDKTVSKFSQFEGRLSDRVLKEIGNDKEKKFDFLMNKTLDVFNEVIDNELFHAKRMNHKSRQEAGMAIANSVHDDMSSRVAKLRGSYDENFSKRYSEQQRIKKEAAEIKSNANLRYSYSNSQAQIANKTTNIVSNFLEDLSTAGGVKVGSGIGMAVLGLAGGLMAAGYASGNPLNDKQAFQVSQEQQPPQQVMSIPDFMDKQGGYVTGNSQQGYIINIKADTKKGRKHMQRIMKQAAEASVGGAVSVNMNIKNLSERGITDSDIENFLDRNL